MYLPLASFFLVSVNHCYIMEISYLIHLISTVAYAHAYAVPIRLFSLGQLPFELPVLYEILPVPEMSNAPMLREGRWGRQKSPKY